MRQIQQELGWTGSGSLRLGSRGVVAGRFPPEASIERDRKHHLHRRRREEGGVAVYEYADDIMMVRRPAAEDYITPRPPPHPGSPGWMDHDDQPFHSGIHGQWNRGTAASIPTALGRPDGTCPTDEERRAERVKAARMALHTLAEATQVRPGHVRARLRKLIIRAEGRNQRTVWVDPAITIKEIRTRYIPTNGPLEPRGWVMEYMGAELPENSFLQAFSLQAFAAGGEEIRDGNPPVIFFRVKSVW